ncbi:hypothetical protein AB6C47_018045 [Vibrio cyclitrophicus]
MSIQMRNKLNTKASGSLSLVENGTWKEQIKSLIYSDFGCPIGHYRRRNFKVNISKNGVIGIDAVGSFYGEKTLKLKFPKSTNEYLKIEINNYVNGKKSQDLEKKNKESIKETLLICKRKLIESINSIEKLENLKTKLIILEMERSNLLGKGCSVVNYKSINGEILRLERDYKYYTETFRSLKKDGISIFGEDESELRKIRFLKEIISTSS